MEKQRNLSIELLRIISMFLIVLHHSVYHGYLKNPTHLSHEALTSVVGCLGAGGKIGVYIFIIISGYFLIQSDKWRFKKIMLLYCEVWFYSIAALIFNAMFHVTHISFKSFITSIFPIMFGNYWFMTTYMILMLFIPFINRCIQTLTKKQFQWLLCLLVVFSILIPTIPHTKVCENDLSLFITLYLTGGYFKKYPLEIGREEQLKRSLVGLLLSTLLLFATVSLLAFRHKSNVLMLAGNYSIFIYLVSICLFNVFANLNIHRGKKLILSLSSATLGVYLIHDNFVIRKFLWVKTLHLTKGGLHWSVIIKILVATVIIYLVCTLIDLCRQWVVKQGRRLYLMAKEKQAS